MPFTKCPSCRKVQQVVPALVRKEIGCMNQHCGQTFQAEEYRLHSGPLSRVIFWFVIAFALFLLIRWVWLNSNRIAYWLG